LLLTAGSRVENEGMQWNARRSNLSEWGASPTLIELVVGWILSDHPKPATDYHLKTGQRE